MKYIIYVIFNIKSNKYYVGSTWLKNSKNRFKTHFYLLEKNIHHSKKLQNSFNKNGKNCFKTFTIEENEGSKEQRWERENFWISFYNSYKNGYNCTQECNGFGHPVSENTKKKISEIVKNQYKNGIRIPPNKKGEKRDKILMQSINQRKKIPIEQYDLEGNFIKEWEGIVIVANQLTLSRTALGNCLKGRSKSCGNFLWKYKYNKKSMKKINRLIEPTKVSQFDLNGNFIANWENQSIAARFFNVYPSGIAESCKNEGRYTCAGFFWKKHNNNYNIKIINIKYCKDIV